MSNSQLTTEERSNLRQFLVDRFNLEEMKDLAFDLGIEYENFAHQTRNAFSRELLGFFERKGNLACLVAEMVERRPDDALVALLARLESCSPRTKIQIVLPGDKLSNKKDLLSKLAGVLGVAPDEVMLIATAPGSIRLLVSLPQEPAERLLALNPSHLGPKYPVQAITAFESLSPAEQDAWRKAAHAGTASAGPGALLARLLTPGVMIGTAVVVVGLLITTIVVVTPRLTVDNQCDEPLGGSATVPVVFGRIIIELPANKATPYRVPPGKYAFLYDGQQIIVTVPIAGRLPPFPARGDLNATINGRPLPVGIEIEEDIGLGARPVIVLCPAGR